MQEGKVKSFNEMKQFGFISNNSGEFFFHINDFDTIYRELGKKYPTRKTPERGDEVSFSTKKTPKGVAAVSITYTKNKRIEALEMENRERDLNRNRLRNEARRQNVKWVDCTAVLEDRGKYGLISTQFDWVLDPIFDEFGLSQGKYQLVRIEQKLGVVSRYWLETNLLIIQPEFDEIEFFPGLDYYLPWAYFKVRTGNKWGVLNNKSEIIYPNLADQIFISQFEDCFNIEINGKLGLVNKFGEVVLEPIFDAVERLYGSDYTFECNGKLGLVNAKSGCLLEPKYDDIISKFHYWNAYIVSLNNKKGIVRTNDESQDSNEWIIAPEFDEIDKITYLPVPLKKNGLWGYLLDEGKTSPFIYDEVRGFKDGYAKVKSRKWGIIDNNYNWVIEPSYDEIINFDVFHKNIVVATVCHRGEKYKVDQHNHRLSLEKYDVVSWFSEGLVTIKLHGKMGVVDKSGQVVIAPIFDEVGNFSEGLASFRKDGKAGYIDEKGNIKFYCRNADYMGMFENGTAQLTIIYDDSDQFRIRDRRETIIIDRSGKTVINRLG
jgi:cold shock CspA family protein